MVLPLLSAACMTTPDRESVNETEDALRPVAVKAQQAKKKPIKVKPQDGSSLTCATVLCAKGHECVDSEDGPTCVPTITCANVLCLPGHECVEEEAGPTCVPSLSCETVLCAAGHECTEDCSGNPVCVPTVCEGIAGLECPAGFECELAGSNPDQGGTCKQDCETCGECTGNEQCGVGEVCTTTLGACLSSCSCPMCDVCAGDCIAA